MNQSNKKTNESGSFDQSGLRLMTRRNADQSKHLRPCFFVQITTDNSRDHSRSMHSGSIAPKLVLQLFSFTTFIRLCLSGERRRTGRSKNAVYKSGFCQFFKS